MRPLASLAAIVLMLASARPALAAWAQAGNSVVNNSLLTFGFPVPGGGFSSLCSDGHGGLIVAYHQNAPSTPDSLKVQRLDRNGTKLWGGANGLLVGPGEGMSNTPTVLADGGGGAWIAYFIGFSGTGFALGVYAQHLDPDGNPTIPFPGIRVGGLSTGMTGQPRAAVTPNGKLLAMWIGQGAVGATDTVRVQRVSQNGALDFTSSGLILGTSTQTGNDMFAQTLLADGEGLVAVWSEETNSTGPDRLRASRVGSTGLLRWGTQGNTVFEDASFPVVFADGIWDATHGLTVAFSASTGDLFVSRVDPLGSVNPLWGSTSSAEVVVSSGTNTGTQRSVRIVDDGANGCVVGWVDGRNSGIVGPGGVPFRNDIRGQRYNASGTRQWATGGVAVNASENDQFALTMLPDNASGAYFGYLTIPRNDSSIDGTGDVEITHVSASGSVLWNTFHSGATQPPSSDGEQTNVQLGADGGGGVMFAWQTAAGVVANHRESDGSVYSPSLVVLTPNGGEFYGTMQPIPITWSSNFGGNVKLEYTINNGTPVTITASTPDDGSQTWFAPILDSNQIRVRVSSVDVPTAFDLSNGFISICPTVNAPYTVGGPVTTPRDVEAADFDGDGIRDLAVAVSGGVAILRGGGAAGVGNATFGGATVYATPAAANRVAIGDFDEDGILDLAVTHASGLMTFRGNGAGGVGNGTFAAGVAVSGIGRCVGIVAADLDNDGVLDLAVADSVNNRVGVFMAQINTLGDGAGTFQSPAFYTVGTQPEGIAAADLDLDGDLDLVTANFGSNSISQLTNTGESGFGSGVFTAHSTSTFAGPHAVVLHDFDDDGDPDVAVANAAGLSVHLNSLAGGVATLGANTDYLSLPQMDLVVADPSRNGIEDIAAASNIGALEVYFGDGSGTIGDGTFTIGGGLGTTGTTPFAIAANDFNEDGRIDFVIANAATNNLTMFTGGCSSAVSTNPVVVSPNGGEVLQPNTLRTIQWTKGVTTTAVDLEVSRDAGVHWEPIATDVVGTSFTWKVDFPASAQARVRVLAHGQPQLGDASNANFTICSPVESSLVAVSVSSQPLDIVAPDVNGDAIRDYVRLTPVGFTVARGLGAAGAGNGQFAADSAYTTPDSARSIAAGDFNEDGLADLLVGLKRGFQLWTAQQGPGGGTGRLTLRQNFTSPPYAVTGLTLFDANADGHLDALLLRQADDSMTVVRGVGDGTLNVALAITLGVPAPARAVAGEFSEDGILDLAVASSSTVAATSGIYVRQGLGSGGVGNGGFGPATRAATTSPVRDLVTGDYNEDGILDLAAVTANGLETFTGSGAGGVGNGGFGASVTQSSFGTGQCIAQLDWNADGRMDLLVGRGSSFLDPGIVRFHHGLGTGTIGNGRFARADQLLTLIPPQRLLAGDFKADGAPDLLADFAGNSQSAVFTGACNVAVESVQIVSPNGGESVHIGSAQTISWTRSATVQSVDLDLSLDSGVTWSAIATNVPGTSFAWTASGSPTAHARLRVSDHVLGTVHDESDADFILFLTSTDSPGAGTPRAIAFSAPQPNPSRGRTAFALTLPAPAAARIELFDAAGRRVRTLLDGLRPAGEHRVAWDGRDDRGALVAPGVYLVRARTAGFEATRRVVRIP